MSFTLLISLIDLETNNLIKSYILATLRALYLGDNDFEYLPSDVENLSSLQILVLRENDLLALPKEIAKLYRLKELHIQVNFLSYMFFLLEFSEFFTYSCLLLYLFTLLILDLMRILYDSQFREIV